MRGRAIPLALLILGLAAPAAVAQYTDGGRMLGMGRATPPDPVVLQGPPAPANFQKLVQLPDAKLAGYQNLYDRFMAQTKPQRDSLVALRNGMGGAGGGADSNDRSSFEHRREVFMPLAQELTERQAAFDDAVKDMLDKAQWKRYQKWRDDQKKEAEQQRQNRWRHRRDGVAPADGQPPA